MSPSQAFEKRPRRRRTGIVITREDVQRAQLAIVGWGLLLGLAYDRIPALRPVLDAALAIPTVTSWRGAFDPEVAHVP